MLDSFLNFGHYALSFTVVLSIIVFIHEFGHYLAARLCGVRIEVFSIGFGREIFGFNDAHGTRWKFSILPLGGYVKMFGDASEASTADNDMLAQLSTEEKAQSFHFKALWQKAIIVAAGPVSNFLLTIMVFTYFIFSSGLSSTQPVIGEVMPDSPAYEAGLQPGDKIVGVDDKEVGYFRDIAIEIALNTGDAVSLKIIRNDAPLDVTLLPRVIEDKDAFGNTIKRPIIGIKSQTITLEQVGLVDAVKHASMQTYALCVTSLRVIGQMISGERDTSQLKGPLGIAKLSGDAMSSGDNIAQTIQTILWFVALLSVNLGLINLLPIPLLDGGHLLFYVFEAIRGRPVAEKAQEYAFRLGFVLLMGLMALTLANDIREIIL
jgi:regulator of sigma E protease